MAAAPGLTLSKDGQQVPVLHQRQVAFVLQNCSIGFWHIPLRCAPSSRRNGTCTLRLRNGGSFLRSRTTSSARLASHSVSFKRTQQLSSNSTITCGSYSCICSNNDMPHVTSCSTFSHHWFFWTILSSWVSSGLSLAAFNSFCMASS